MSEIVRVISKSDERAARGFDLKSQNSISDQNCTTRSQLPLYYSHFEIAEFSQYHYFISLLAGLLKSKNGAIQNRIRT